MTIHNPYDTLVLTIKQEKGVSTMNIKIENLPAESKIGCIKIARSAFAGDHEAGHMGLREAKNAVEAVKPINGMITMTGRLSLWNKVWKPVVCSRWTGYATQRSWKDRKDRSKNRFSQWRDRRNGYSY